MTPELKSFLTDLLAVLENHDAEIFDYQVHLKGVETPMVLIPISPDEIKQVLQEL